MTIINTLLSFKNKCLSESSMGWLVSIAFLRLTTLFCIPLIYLWFCQANLPGSILWKQMELWRVAINYLELSERWFCFQFFDLLCLIYFLFLPLPFASLQTSECFLPPLSTYFTSGCEQTVYLRPWSPPACSSSFAPYWHFWTNQSVPFVFRSSPPSVLISEKPCTSFGVVQCPPVCLFFLPWSYGYEGWLHHRPACVAPEQQSELDFVREPSCWWDLLFTCSPPDVRTLVPIMKPCVATLFQGAVDFDLFVLKTFRKVVTCLETC